MKTIYIIHFFFLRIDIIHRFILCLCYRYTVIQFSFQLQKNPQKAALRIKKNKEAFQVMINQKDH